MSFDYTEIDNAPEEREVPWYLGGTMKGTYPTDFLKALGYVEVPNTIPLIRMKDIVPIDFTKMDMEKYRFKIALPFKKDSGT